MVKRLIRPAFWGKIGLLWRRLTEPSAVLNQAAQRREARLTAAQFFLFLVMTVVVVIVRQLQDSTSAFEFGLVVILVLGVAYLFSRTSYYYIGQILVVAGIPAVCYPLAVVFPTTTLLIPFMSLTILVGVLLSVRLVIVGIVVNAIGALLLPIFIPSWNYVIVGTELIFVPIVSIVGLILALIRYQDNWLLDQQTQARLKLEQQQKEYLEENEYRFRSFFEGIQIGMVILNYQGHPVYTNPQLTKLLGYTPEEFASRPFASLVTPEDSFNCRVLLHKLLSGEIQQERAEKRMVSKNGDVVWTRIHIGTFPHTRPFPIEDFLIAVVEDITDSKLIEAQLAATQIYNQAILEAMPDMVFTVSREGIFTGFKPSNEIEPLVPPEAFIGQSMATVLPEIADMTMEHVRHVLDTGKGVRFEYQMNINAVSRDYEARVIAKNAREVLIFVRDMNDRKQLEQQAVELALGHQRSAVLHELMTSISHDFRTPLAIVNTQTYLIRRAGVSDGQAAQITNIEEQVRYLKTTLDNLSEVLHLNEDLNLVIQTIPLQEIARQVYLSYTHPAQEKQIALELELDSNVPPLPMDRERLSDALQRLIENALDYTPAQGKVTMRVYREADSAVIAVRDTGIGISEEHLQHIFKPLYRADHARSGVSSGKTGLGLSIVQHIITAHGGRIEVESQVDQGSVFRVILPLAAR